MTPGNLARRLTTTLALLLCGCSGVCPLGPSDGLSVGLADYVLTLGPVKVPEIRRNASGLTFNRENGLLYMVSNGPSAIVEMTTDGKARRVIRLRGFGDTEGIAHVRGTTYAVCAEGRSAVYLVELDEKTEVLQEAEATRIGLEVGPVDNNGLEGLALDPNAQRFWVVREKKPRGVYTLPVYDRVVEHAELAQPWDAQRHPRAVTDLAGVYLHRATGHVLVLSQESGCVVECTQRGRELSRLMLQAASAGLEQKIPHPEGLTMDEQGRLYICSEPDLFYVFEKRRE